MRKFIVLIVIYLVLYLMSGCTYVSANLGDAYVLGKDDQYYFNKDAQNLSTAETKDGYYFFSGPNSTFLYYIDKRTMSPVILCDKPDCLHSDETDHTKVMNCNAYSYYNSNLVYYDGYLYVAGNNPVSINDEYIVYRISLDGTQKKELYSFKEKPENWIIHRGFIYFTTNDNGTIQGQEADTKSTCKLYRLDIKQINKEPILLNEKSGVYERTLKLFGYGNGIYWLTMGFNDGSMTNVSRVAIKCNILDGETVIFGDDITYLSACNGKLVFRSGNGIMYVNNQDGSDKKEIGKIGNNGIIYCDGFRYIYCDTLPLTINKPSDSQKDKEIRSLLVYDIEGKLVNTINIDSLGKDLCYGGNNDYFFIPDNRSTSNEFGDVNKLYILNMNRITSIDTAISKVFEFIPKSEFPGVSYKSN